MYRVWLPKGRKLNAVPNPKTERTKNPQVAHPVEIIPKIPPPPTTNFTFPFVFNLFTEAKISAKFIPVKIPAVSNKTKLKEERAVKIPKKSELRRFILKTSEDFMKKLLKISL